ncbi:unnamed protein product [Prorocentrum cordatum]|uniref:Macrocin O-methyltransferase n=1 Tax=Prorocentrum cordatum TaxID=2364126 RepID=A0ABN9PQK2_9DINO|nr:unnamed protein product [Polarella glacialis]
MELLHELLHSVYFDRKIEGDFLEAGVWRGGSSIYAKGFMEAYELTNARVWLLDSFRGLPEQTRSLDDPTANWHLHDYLAVPKEQVEDHFRRYLLFDERVKFVEGFFQQSLPNLVRSGSLTRPLGILRIDCDTYSATLEVLCFLYESVHVGGYCIADDFEIQESRRAILDFLRGQNITSRIVPVGDGKAAWFEKTSEVSVDSLWCRRQLGSSPILYRHPARLWYMKL